MDMIKLEGTNAVRGIDMNAVWKKVCDQRLTLITDCPFEFGKYFHFDGSWKEHFFAVFTSLLLNLFYASHFHRRVVSDLVILLIGYPNFCAFTEPVVSHPTSLYQCFIANRFISLYYDIKGIAGKLEALSSITSYVMNECHYRPKIVYISCTLFYYSPFWKERDSPELSCTLREFLSDTQQLVFSTKYDLNSATVSFTFEDEDEGDIHDMFHAVPLYVMEVILSSNNPKLETLIITNTCSVFTVQSIVCTVFKLLCEFDISEPERFLTSFSTESLLKNVPYKHLKRLSLSMDTSHSQQLDVVEAERLESAIKFQTGLEAVQLNGWPCGEYLADTRRSWYSEGFSHLFSVLASLFKQPQFWNLELENTSFLPHNLQEVLHTFFTVGSFNHQTLKLGSIHVFPFTKYADSEMSSAFPAVDSNSNDTLLNKSLHLSDFELSHEQEMLIFSYPLLKLESLTLVNIVSMSHSKSLERAGELLCMNKISYLKTLILKDIVVLHQTPQSVVSSLLQSPNLQYLEIEHCDIGPGGLLASLSHEIPNCGNLEILKLVRVNLGTQSEDDFRKLFNGIFSLPHVSKLSLDVSSNELTLYHFTIIMNVWKQTCSGMKLEELIISGNVLEPDLLPLPNIAQHVVY